MTLGPDAVALDRVVAAMAGYRHSWAVAGGWALDLFLGTQSRSHKDVDIATCRRDQRALHDHLVGFATSTVMDGHRLEWPRGDWLALPVHEIHASRDGLTFEILLNECDQTEWTFRRDARIRRDLAAAIRSAASVPYLAPEIVLLYKAKRPTQTDHSDFAAVAPHLALDQTRWLAHALATCYPGHTWLRWLGAEA